MKKASFLSFLLFCLGSPFLLSQTAYEIDLTSGTFLPEANMNAKSSLADLLGDQPVQGRYHRLIQFHQLPDLALHRTLEQLDIQLLTYIPNFAYLTSLPASIDEKTLFQLPIRSITSFPAQAKLANNLWEVPYPDWALSGDRIELEIYYYQDLAGGPVHAALQGLGCEVIDHSDAYHYVQVLAPLKQLTALSELSFVAFVSPIAPPPVPESLPAYTLHRSHILNMGPRKYDGTGIKVLVRDDGLVGPHVDFKNRLTNLTSDATGTHGDGVAGCIGGAGNKDPNVIGMAPGSDISVINYQANFTDNTLSLHQNAGILITNSSYSDGCNRGYSGRSRTVDEQIFDNPTLMHVFSAGNDGDSDCGYGAGTGWGNVTGGHKLAKNALTVGSVSRGDVLSRFSSRGPAADGRVKPEVVAMGESYQLTNPNHSYMSAGGTSFSAPATAGVMAQLYHAYKVLNQDQTPPSALIKAIMINTCDDLGREGPDFGFGYGRINALQAAKVLEGRQYVQDTISVNQTETHSFSIPPNVSQVKVMLYWPDQEAQPNVARPLINDLDLLVKDLGGTAHQPLVLDYRPTVNSLAGLAIPGRDSINNMEQVVLHNPQTGMYTIEIQGNMIPFGQVPYYVIYQFILDEIEVIFPNNGEGLLPGVGTQIRWDAIRNDSLFKVEYTLDNGQNWITITDNLPGSFRHVTWAVPQTFTGQARVRVSRGQQSDESDQNFSIIGTPNNMQLLRVCQDFVTLTWDAISGATAYDVFMLGDKYMDSIGTTVNTVFEVPNLRFQDENWFAVRCRGDSGLVGIRNIAIQSTPNLLVNCDPFPPVAAFQVDTVICVNQAIALLDQSTKAPDTWGWNVTPGSNTAFVQGTSPTSQNPVLRFSAIGTYQVSLFVNNQAGADTRIITVQVVDSPVPDFTQTINGLSLTFTNQTVDATSYLWDFGDGNSSTMKDPMHTYSAVGDYLVTLTAMSPCDTVTLTKPVQAWATSIDDLWENISLQVTPNPSEGIYQLTLSGEKPGNFAFDVMNIHGQKLQSFTLSHHSGTQIQILDLSDHPGGVYLLRMAAEGRVGVLKLMVEK